MRILSLLIFVALSCQSQSNNSSSVKVISADNSSEAVLNNKLVIDLLLEKEYQKITAGYFNKNLVQNLDATKLKEVFLSLESQMGKLQSFNESYDINQDNYYQIYTEAVFDNGTFYLQLVFDNKNRISGFFIKPQLPKSL